MKILRFIRTGIAHEEKGIECQDTAEYLQYSADIAVMAISDGAGQAQYAKKASECNVRAILELFNQIPVENFIEKTEEEQKNLILSQCMRLITQEATKVSCNNLNHFSATLVFAVIAQEFILTGHLGDGAIYMTDSDNRRCFSSGPENIQVAHRTYFTISREAYEHLYLQIIKRDEIKPVTLLMMSDGPQLMFKDRGFGIPEETAEEMASFISSGQVRSDEDLGSLLDAMTELEAEKMDDWSLLAVALEMEEKEEELEKDSEQKEEEPEEEKTDLNEKNIVYISEEDYHQFLKDGGLSYKLIEQIMRGKNYNHDTVHYNSNQYSWKAIMMEELLKRYPEKNRWKEMEEETDRLRNVIATLKQLTKCQNIVEVVEAFEIRSNKDKRVLMFLVLEKKTDAQKTVQFYLDRGNLDRAIKIKVGSYVVVVKSRYKERYVSEMTKSILQALVKLEEHQLVHGNINFKNILVDVNDGRPKFILSGFENAAKSNSKNKYKDICNLAEMLAELRFGSNSKWMQIIKNVQNQKYRNAKEMLHDVENI